MLENFLFLVKHQWIQLINHRLKLWRFIPRIEIDIDFNERPRDVDPLKAIERLEQIERETIQRLDHDQNGRELNNATGVNLPNAAASFASCTMSLLEECELWRAEREPEPNNVLSFEEFSPRNMTSRNHYESEFE